MLSVPAFAADPMHFWNTPQRGANSFNGTPPDAEYFRALRGYGATWVRLTFSKWKSRERDFLFGSLDDYQRLVPEDLATLRRVLDDAHAAGLKVVVTPLSLPGSRWIQQNGNQFDDRLWNDKRYWRQSAAFWRDLAGALEGHPAIAALNLINEPVPERRGGLEEHSPPETMRAWYEKVRGGTRDLPALYALLVAAVRQVDPEVPVMLDGGFYAAADGWSYWPAPLRDDRLLYAYHMYEPWAATSAPNIKRQVPYRYPGRAPFGGTDVEWNAARIESYLQQPVDWAKRHHVPMNRLVAGEFGCVRTWSDCPRYLEDVLAALEADGVHWAFYAFREDTWDAMDYELGAGRLPWQYWEAQEKGKPYVLPRGPNTVFDPIMRRLASGRPRCACRRDPGHGLRRCEDPHGRPRKVLRVARDEGITLRAAGRGGRDGVFEVLPAEPHRRTQDHVVHGGHIEDAQQRVGRVSGHADAHRARVQVVDGGHGMRRQQPFGASLFHRRPDGG
jgi:hypothetical protein